MVYMWMMASTLYYFMSYYVIYLPGNTWTNNYASGGAELVGTLFGGLMIKYASIKMGFIVSNVIALVGGLMIMFLGPINEDLMAINVAVAKFGVSSTYTLVYAHTVFLFPTLFAATAYGTSQLACNLSTIAAPYLAEMNEPIPMLVYTIMAGIAIAMSFIIQQPK